MLMLLLGKALLLKSYYSNYPNADVVFIPVGGGGLLAGMAVYLKQLSP